MTCEPIEIICDQCGRLRTSVLASRGLFKGINDEETRRELEQLILAMHREAQHPKETKP